jgi:hypothetical protein
VSPGEAPIPREELSLAADLYKALQAFYTTHHQYQDRPLYITGEVRPAAAAAAAWQASSSMHCNWT